MLDSPPEPLDEIELGSADGCGCVRPPVVATKSETTEQQSTTPGSDVGTRRQQIVGAWPGESVSAEPEDYERSRETNNDRESAVDEEIIPSSPDTPAETGTADVSNGPQLRGGSRGMRLVVTLRLDPSGSYRALVALGADDCDPEIRVAVVPDLLAALDEVPAVLAAAQARWQTQPRYSAPPRSASVGRIAARTHGASVPPVAPPMPPSAPAPDATSELLASEGAPSTTVPVSPPPETTQSGRSSTPQLALFN